MPVTKDNWQGAFGLDSAGNVIMKTTVSTGGGIDHVKDLDFGLQQVIVNGTFRIIIV